MPSNVFIDTSNFYPGAAVREDGAAAPAKAARRATKFPWRDLPAAVLPVLIALLLTIGFGIAAEPLLAKDLPLLLVQSDAAPAPTAL